MAPGKDPIIFRRIGEAFQTMDNGWIFHEFFGPLSIGSISGTPTTTGTALPLLQSRLHGQGQTGQGFDIGFVQGDQGLLEDPKFFRFFS